MTVTRQQAEMLVELAVACRPTGAPVWHKPGIFAAIGKVKGRSLASVTIAVIQAAEDRGAESPAVIASAGSHWRQPEPGDRPASRPPKRDEACLDCGRFLESCLCGNQRTRPAPVDPEVAVRGAALARELLRPPPIESTPEYQDAAACAALQPTHTDTEEQQ